jgi:hypothetical protein
VQEERLAEYQTRSTLQRVLTRTFLVGLVSLAGGLLLPGAAANAESDKDLFLSSLPKTYHYGRGNAVTKPRSISFRRDESRAVEAPTRYRTQSILRYSKQLGDTGLILKVKAPLKPRKLIKLELRF